MMSSGRTPPRHLVRTRAPPRSPCVAWHRGAWGLVVPDHLDQAIVDEYAVQVAEQLFARFFDAHPVFLEPADLEDVYFADGFVHEPVGNLDGASVYFDHQPPDELVEVVFQTMLFLFSELDAESHKQQIW